MSLSPDEFEKRMHRVLRSLPDRTAPASLEQRVLAQVAQRAAQPWWRRSYTGWPVAMRLAFFVISAAAAALAIAAVTRLGASAMALPANALRSAAGDWLSIGNTIGHAIPNNWIYGAAAALIACYAALFGVGAAAYRTYFSRT